MSNVNYSAVVESASKELSARERIMVKDFTNAIKLDMATADGQPLVITPDYYAVISVHNDKSDNKDYMKYVIVDKEGNKFVTGSENFFSTFMNIQNEMQGEPFDLSIYQAPSKNYKNKKFLTCSIV